MILVRVEVRSANCGSSSKYILFEKRNYHSCDHMLLIILIIIQNVFFYVLHGALLRLDSGCSNS